MSLFGVETEYAVSALGRNGQSLDQQTVVKRLVGLAKKQLPTLQEVGGWGLFLSNGSRFYVDSGLHPELATPEVNDPVHLVRYILAGERFLANLIEEIEHDTGKKSHVMCFRCNVDYSGTGSTWGCHESFLHRSDPSAMPEQMIPHLVTRIIYTGSGGFDSTSLAVRFLLSPRVPHLVKVVSSSSTCERGIFHDKDESLSGEQFHRLHLLSGESLSSQRAMWLKAATTALIVALIDAGFQPGTAVKLQSPIHAMWTIAADPECKASITLANGSQSSAVAVQRHYLDLVEKHVVGLFAPPWAAEACRQWRQTLDLLERAPDSVTTTLDWALKLQLYRHRVHKRGMTWESLTRWNPFAERLQAALSQTAHARDRVTPDLVLGPNSPIRDEVQALTSSLASSGLHWEELGEFLALRRELFEIDMRFGQLHDESIFSKLDHAGLLSHRVPGVDQIESAVVNPPSYGRARLRGEVIARVAGQNGRYVCDWQSIWDQAESRFLDLSNPFSTEEHWRDAQGDEGEMAALSLFGLNARAAWLRRNRARNVTR